MIVRLNVRVLSGLRLRGITAGHWEVGFDVQHALHVSAMKSPSSQLSR